MSGIAHVIACGAQIEVSGEAFEPGDVVVVGPSAAPHAAPRARRLRGMRRRRHAWSAVAANAVVPIPERAELWGEVDIPVHGAASLYTQELGLAVWVRGRGAAGSVAASVAFGVMRANAATGQPGITPGDHPYVDANGLFVSLGTRVRW